MGVPDGYNIYNVLIETGSNAIDYSGHKPLCLGNTPQLGEMGFHGFRAGARVGKNAPFSICRHQAKTIGQQ